MPKYFITKWDKIKMELARWLFAVMFGVSLWLSISFIIWNFGSCLSLDKPLEMVSYKEKYTFVEFLISQRDWIEETGDRLW